MNNLNKLNILKEWKENNPQVKNIMIFISDAHRWDYLPKAISDKGITFKTIASGILTPTSISSIITGVYPWQHGVFSFIKDTIPKELHSLFDIFGYNTSFTTENTWTQWTGDMLPPLNKILRQRNNISLNEIKPPFIYVEDEKGGHCPFGWTPEDKYDDGDCLSFFKDYGKKSEKELRKRYEKGIQRSVKEFDKRLNILEERGLLDETLVIFLSDHGELLGEYGGLVGHGNTTTPEIVYVPTVFIHPNLKKGINFENEGLLRHVDIYPTICDLLGTNIKNKVDGISLFKMKKLPKFGITYHEETSRKRTGIKGLINYELKEISIWDNNGGHLYREGTNIVLNIIRAIGYIILFNTIVSVYKKQKLGRIKHIDFIKSYIESIKYLSLKHIKYGNPSFQKGELVKRIYRSLV